MCIMNLELMKEHSLKLYDTKQEILVKKTSGEKISDLKKLECTYSIQGNNEVFFILDGQMYLTIPLKSVLELLEAYKFEQKFYIVSGFEFNNLKQDEKLKYISLISEILIEFEKEYYEYLGKINNGEVEKEPEKEIKYYEKLNIILYNVNLLVKKARICFEEEQKVLEHCKTELDNCFRWSESLIRCYNKENEFDKFIDLNEATERRKACYSIFSEIKDIYVETLFAKNRVKKNYYNAKHVLERAEELRADVIDEIDDAEKAWKQVELCLCYKNWKYLAE